MNLILKLLNQAYAVGYIPKEPNPVPLPFFPTLDTIENIILFILFFTLIIPLLKNQTDKRFEKSRVKISKLSTFIAVLFLAIQIYRLASSPSQLVDLLN